LTTLPFTTSSQETGRFLQPRSLYSAAFWQSGLLNHAESGYQNSIFIYCSCCG